jgi:hypothetical protein
LKTYILRRRLLTTESGTITLKLPTNFGTPKAAIFHATNSTASDGSFSSFVEYPFISVGFAGNSGVSGGTHVNRCITTMCKGGVSPLTSYTTLSTAFVLHHSTSDGVTVYRRLSCDSFSADTITCTLVNVNTPTEVCDLVITVFAGDDLTVGVNSITLPNSLVSPNVSFSTLTFQPDCVLFIYGQQSTGSGTPPTGGATGFQINFGAALRDGSLTQRSSGISSAHNATTVDHRSGVNNNSVAVGRRGGTDNVNALTAFSTTGFTITVQTSAPGGPYPIYFLAFKSKISDYSLGTISTPTNATPQTQTISLPFVPQCILGSMTHVASNGINVRQGSTAAIAVADADSYSLFVAKGENISPNRGTGGLSYNPSSSTVTGTSTLFTQQLSPGDILYDPLYTSIGVVSSISNDTSLQLVSLASIAPTNGNAFYYKKPSQYNIAYGNDDGLAPSTSLFTKINSSNAICADTAPSSANMIGKINDFTTRNEFKIQYTTLNATAATGALGRLGWYLAIKNTESSRRRVNIS